MIEPIAENNVGKQDNATLTKAANIMKKYKKKYNDIKNDYQKRTKICEQLGALKFQKVVFKVEKIKYDILQKVCPNFIKYYEKLSDKIVKRKLKKYHSEPRKKEILENHRLNKMLMRKEINRKQNRNYHIDEYLPTSMVHYLEWNKKIHKKGAKVNLAVIPILGVAAVIGFSPAIPFLVMEVGSLLINCQCINIQNYNIYRLKSKEEKLRKIEKRNLANSAKKYNDINKVVSKSFEKKEEIPTPEAIIDNLKTKEELQQLKSLLIKEIYYRNNTTQKNNIKGGHKR